MVSITIDLDDDAIKVLNKRAKKDFLDLKAEIEDIVRRSCISFKKNSGVPKDIGDDKLINIFSRATQGRKRK